MHPQHTTQNLTDLLALMDLLEETWDEVEKRVRAYGFAGPLEYLDTPLDCRGKVEEALAALKKGNNS